MNSQTGKEMLVNLVEYHVYQQLKALISAIILNTKR